MAKNRTDQPSHVFFSGSHFSGNFLPWPVTRNFLRLVGEPHEPRWAGDASMDQNLF